MAADRPRVLLTTEGTYPFTVGGVGTWCDQLLRNLTDIDWAVFAITAGGRRLRPSYGLPPNARMAAVVDLWGVRGRRSWSLGRRAARVDLASRLALACLSWNAPSELLIDELVWCRRHPTAVLASFRLADSWTRFVETLRVVLAEAGDDFAPGLRLDMATAVRSYQTLAWVARAAAAPVPEVDLVHVTAAGWAAIPALTEQALTGLPVLLSEHGVYVRESYLSSVRSWDNPPQRFLSTRLARSLARAAYHVADLVCPVTDSHHAWERLLGAPPERIRTIPNGVSTPPAITPAPRQKLVVSVGRIDPLKDVKTMLRVAAEVLRRHPDAQFLHYGPVSPEQDAYGDACRRLHGRLQLGDRFRFMGPTADPTGAVRRADVALLTSISEGLPMAVLEAMAQGRPVVTTQVGGTLDAMRGAGLTAAPRDVVGLAEAVSTLLDDPALAAALGARGFARIRRRFSQDQLVAGYRHVIDELLAGSGSARARVSA